MKKFIIYSIVTVLTTCGLYAQDVKFGIRGGVNMASMATVEKTPVSEGYDGILAPGFGIFTELQINPTASFRFGVEYSGLGGKKNGIQAMPLQRLITEIGNSVGMGITEQHLLALYGLSQFMPPYYYVNVDNTVKFDYVTIPLLAQFGWDIGQTPWHVYVNAGPCISLILSGKQVAKGNSKMFIDESGNMSLWDFIEMVPPIPNFGILSELVVEALPGIDKKLGEPVNFEDSNITGEMKSANFGVTGNLGIRYKNNRNYFFFEIGGNYGFYTVQDDDVSGSNRLSAFSIMAGYSISLF